VRAEVRHDSIGGGGAVRRASSDHRMLKLRSQRGGVRAVGAQQERPVGRRRPHAQPGLGASDVGLGRRFAQHGAGVRHLGCGLSKRLMSQRRHSSHRRARRAMSAASFIPSDLEGARRRGVRRAGAPRRHHVQVLVADKHHAHGAPRRLWHHVGDAPRREVGLRRAGLRRRRDRPLGHRLYGAAPPARHPAPSQPQPARVSSR
jgi:hypothetical protein